jgi:hypothetical protein
LLLLHEQDVQLSIQILSIEVRCDSMMKVSQQGIRDCHRIGMMKMESFKDGHMSCTAPCMLKHVAKKQISIAAKGTDKIGNVTLIAEASPRVPPSSA